MMIKEKMLKLLNIMEKQFNPIPNIIVLIITLPLSTKDKTNLKKLRNGITKPSKLTPGTVMPITIWLTSIKMK